MAKRLELNKIKILIYATVALIIFFVLAVPALSRGEREREMEEDIEPAFAPAEYAYPEYFTNIPLDDGYTWRINDRQMFELTDGEHTYMVTPDGTVYEVGPDGALIEVTDPETISRVLAKAGEASGDSDTAKDYFSTPMPLDDDAIAALVGDDVDPDDFRLLQEAGLLPEEIQALEDSGYDIDRIADVIRDGGNADDEIARQEDLLGRLEDSIANSGMGVSVPELLDMLEEAGLTPEEYLAGLDAISPSSKENTSGQGASFRTSGELPALTVDLGGDSGEVEEKEEAYQEMIASGNFDPAALASAVESVNRTQNDFAAQNDQEGKRDFVSSYAGNTGSDYLTKNDIAPGTVVSMILRTGLNSDLPGEIIAEVTQNVYDSLTGTRLLIPKGTRLLATYSSSVTFGQKRALVVWTQLVRPDGFMLRLPGLPGIDAQGYTGFKDQVDNHIWDLLWASALSTLMDIGVDELIYQVEDVAGWGILGELMGDYADSLSTAGQDYLDKVINQQPTLKIRPGRTVKLMVNTKLTLPEFKGF